MATLTSAAQPPRAPPVAGADSGSPVNNDEMATKQKAEPEQQTFLEPERKESIFKKKRKKEKDLDELKKEVTMVN